MLFQPSVLNKYLKLQNNEETKKAYKKFVKHFHNATIQENIKNSKEEEYQGPFLTDLFVNILGYTMKPQPFFNLVAEQKNQTNSRKSDGAILKEDTAIAVIELKGTKTKDLKTITEQAFGYKANQKGCIYVITSNYEKLRFYINDATEFVEFNLFTLTETDFEILYLCTSKESIFLDLPHKIKTESIVKEEQITKEFYKDYSQFKRELYRDLVKLNAKNLKTPKENELVNTPLEDEQLQKELAQLEKNVKLALFKKSQKLIDRFLFIFFAEDRGLLPPNSTKKILDKWKADVSYGDARPVYNMFKSYFNFLDTGRKATPTKDGVKGRDEIYAYNGGLFKPDSILDRIEISDELLYEHTLKLSNYDFDSQIDVNILGHIFENSLNEIESVNAEIEGGDFDKQKSKRKKDGVFYTPKYITKYIVENTVGKLCEEKKLLLGIYEEEYAKGRFKRNKETVKKLDNTLISYREWLLKITICDPACGSGAFLNQALEFLIQEHNYISELEGMLYSEDKKTKGGGVQKAFATENIEKTILENNIFGVDLNEESVEIAKLSLWLRTAQPRRKLNNLNSNIKCGNSVVYSKEIASDKAFNWNKEFPEIFAKGGFDVIIGNPPYVSNWTMSDSNREMVEWLSKAYKDDLTGHWDLFICFISISIRHLKEGGYNSFILPTSFLKEKYGKLIREKIIRELELVEIIDFGEDVIFENVARQTFIYNLRKNKLPENKVKIRFGLDDFGTSVPQKFFTTLKNCTYKTNVSSDDINIYNKLIQSSYKMGELFCVNVGVVAHSKSGSPSQFKKDDVIYNEYRDGFKKYVVGPNFSRYSLLFDEQYMDYENNKDYFHRSKFNLLFESKKIILRRTSGNNNSIIAYYDVNEFYTNDSIMHLVRWSDEILKHQKPEKRWSIDTNSNINEKFVLAILCSRLVTYYFSKFLSTDTLQGAYSSIYPEDVREFPIIKTKEVNQLVLSKLANNMQDLNISFQKTSRVFLDYFKIKFNLEKLSKKLQNWHELEFGEFIKELNKAIKTVNKERAKNEESLVEVLTKSDEMEWMELFNAKKKEAQALKTQIDQTDREIDQMVYKLYELTDEEIGIVEGS